MEKKPARLQCNPLMNMFDGRFSTLPFNNFTQMPRRNMKHRRIVTHFMPLLKEFVDLCLKVFK